MCKFETMNDNPLFQRNPRGNTLQLRKWKKDGFHHDRRWNVTLWNPMYVTFVWHLTQVSQKEKLQKQFVFNDYLVTQKKKYCLKKTRIICV
jgi:hypothetical protein